MPIAKAPPRAALDMNIGASKPPEVPEPSEITSASDLKIAIKSSRLQREVVVQNVGNRVVPNAQNARDEESDDAQAERANRRMPQVVDRQAVE